MKRILIALAVLAVVAGGVFAANEVVWKVGDSAYVDAEGDATFNSVTADISGTVTGAVVATTVSASGAVTLNGNTTVGNATTDVVKVYMIENSTSTNGIPAYQLYSSNGTVRIWGN